MRAGSAAATPTISLYEPPSVPYLKPRSVMSANGSTSTLLSRESPSIRR